MVETRRLPSESFSTLAAAQNPWAYAHPAGTRQRCPRAVPAVSRRAISPVGLCDRFAPQMRSATQPGPAPPMALLYPPQKRLKSAETLSPPHERSAAG